MHFFQAIEVVHAERIGHGYKVLESPEIYAQCLAKDIHFETCPHSSILTGAIHMKNILTHPIVRLANDNVNFSMYTDGPTVTGSWMADEVEMVQSWGLNEVHLARIVRVFEKPFWSS